MCISNLDAWSQRRQQRAFEGMTLHAAAQYFLQGNAFSEINDDIREYWDAPNSLLNKYFLDGVERSETQLSCIKFLFVGSHPSTQPTPLILFKN